MINPSMMRDVSREHVRDLRALGAPRRYPRHLPSLRTRLGWALVGLGARLALDGRPVISHT
ncbi:MAG: hypothetical protein J2P57_10450 [Acidimicrobiaceae bacterium]|nr:hypothetical protein [Acidimicrobiaceae bacterium]